MEYCKCCGQPINECADKFCDDEDIDDSFDREEQEEWEDEQKLSCVCGAYYLGKDGRVHQIADCCCGRV
jgi:hypothetical protein